MEYCKDHNLKLSFEVCDKICSSLSFLLLHKKRKPPCFLIVVGKATIPSGSSTTIYLHRTPPWQADCSSLPSTFYHAQQLGLIRMNPSVAALSVQS